MANYQLTPAQFQALVQAGRIRPVTQSISGFSMPANFGAAKVPQLPRNFNPNIPASVGRRVADIGRKMLPAGTDISRESDVSVSKSEFEQLKSTVRRIADYVKTGSGGELVQADYASGRSRFVRGNRKGKGGYVYTDEQTFPVAPVAGSKVTLEFTGTDLARLQSTDARFLEIIADDELEAKAHKFELTINVNGMEDEEFYRLPLDKLIEDLDGRDQGIPLDIMVGASDQLTLEIVAREAVEFGSIQAVQARVLAV